MGIQQRSGLKKKNGQKSKPSIRSRSGIRKRSGLSPKIITTTITKTLPQEQPKGKYELLMERRQKELAKAHKAIDIQIQKEKEGENRSRIINGLNEHKYRQQLFYNARFKSLREKVRTEQRARAKGITYSQQRSIEKSKNKRAKQLQTAYANQQAFIESQGIDAWKATSSEAKDYIRGNYKQQKEYEIKKKEEIRKNHNLMWSEHNKDQWKQIQEWEEQGITKAHQLFPSKNKKRKNTKYDFNIYEPNRVQKDNPEYDDSGGIFSLNAWKPKYLYETQVAPNRTDVAIGNVLFGYEKNKKAPYLSNEREAKNEWIGNLPFWYNSNSGNVYSGMDYRSGLYPNYVAFNRNVIPKLTQTQAYQTSKHVAKTAFNLGKRVIKETPSAGYELMFRSADVEREMYKKILNGSIKNEQQFEEWFEEVWNRPKTYEKYPVGTGVVAFGTTFALAPSYIQTGLIYGSGALGLKTGAKGYKQYTSGDYLGGSENIVYGTAEAIPAIPKGLKWWRNIRGRNVGQSTLNIKYPTSPRWKIVDYLKDKRGKKVLGAHGETSKDIYISDVYQRNPDGSIRQTTEGVPGYWATPVSSVQEGLPMFHTGRFAVNPWNNPTYWLNQLLGNNKRINPLKWNINRNSIYITEGKVNVPETKNIKKFYEDSLKKAVETKTTQTTIAPKTLKESKQPEEEFFNVLHPEQASGIGHVYVGKNPTGQNIFVEFTKKGFLADIAKRAEIKARWTKNNYKSTLKEQDLISKDVAERSKLKWSLIEKNSPEQKIFDNSPYEHSEQVYKIAQQLENKYKIGANKDIMKAFAEVHDINKEYLINHDMNHLISHGVAKGYFDYIPSVKKLNSKQKAILTKTIYNDERPPLTVHNLVLRHDDTVRKAGTILTDEQKLIINADRLARFGNKADPNMLYKIKGKKITQEEINKLPPPKKDTRSKAQKEAEYEYERSNYKQYEKYPSVEGKYKYGENYKYKGTTTTYLNTYGSGKYKINQQIPYNTPYGGYKYQTPNTYTPYTPYEPPKTGTPPYIGTPEKTSQIITTTTIKKKKKKEQKKKEKELYTDAWLVYTGNKGRLKESIIVKTKDEAENAARDIVDKGHDTAFKLKAITAHPRYIRQWTARNRHKHKFTRRRNTYYEKPKYQQDTYGENNFLFKALKA